MMVIISDEIGDDEQNKKMRIMFMMIIMIESIVMIATVKTKIQSQQRGTDMT
jgi:hypothetical protein